MSTESNEPVEPADKPAEEPAEAWEPPTESTEDEAPAKKSWLKFVIVGVLAIALIGGAVYLFQQVSGGWAVGDCATAKLRDDGKLDATSKSCSSDDASYKVAKILPSENESCPEEGLYELAPYDSKQLCLMPNFEEGACYVPNDEGMFKKGGCTGEAVVKVTKRFDGKPDPIQCPDGSTDLIFSEPAVVYCLGTGDNP